MAFSTIPGIATQTPSVATDDQIELGGVTKGSRRINASAAFPLFLNSLSVVCMPTFFLESVTGQTGGGPTNLDGLDISQAPAGYNYRVDIDAASGQKSWLLRPRQAGDPVASVTDVAVIPTGSNPNNLIFAAFS
jgi:hypothetical protein